jgi:acetyltransferase-like isoleucine patch superfamily enzyme
MSNLQSFSQRSMFALRFKLLHKTASKLRIFIYSLSGLKVGRNTSLSRLSITWPHQVAIGNNCILEKQIYFKFDGIWKPGPSIIIGDHVFIGTGCEFNIRKMIRVGNDALIASGCRFIDHDHGTAPDELIRKQHGAEKEIIIGNNTWIGCNVTILKGVKIGDGAVVAAGAVVTKSILSNEIWAGVPAKKIGERTSKFHV